MRGSESATFRELAYSNELNLIVDDLVNVEKA
jgi:hypothetical protein